jgi:hypothetical protein
LVKVLSVQVMPVFNEAVRNQKADGPRNRSTLRID